MYDYSVTFRLQLNKGEGQFSLSFKGNMNLTAKYVADGRILILPIQGNGDALVDAREYASTFGQIYSSFRITVHEKVCIGQ